MYWIDYVANVEPKQAIHQSIILSFLMSFIHEALSVLKLQQKKKHGMISCAEYKHYTAW